MDFNLFEALTFDCYGTLVDWETGLLNALRPILANHTIEIEDESLLAHYAEWEAEIEAEPYRPYREVLKEVIARMGLRWGFIPTESEKESLPESIKEWEPFPDTVEALANLKQRYRLAVVSNIDGDLFQYTARKLKVEWDVVVTAQQAGSYKPSLRNFRETMERLALPPEKILHVAESLYHDVLPAQKLGIQTVWVHRRHEKEGRGATKAVQAIPDMKVPDLQTLVQIIVG